MDRELDKDLKWSTRAGKCAHPDSSRGLTESAEVQNNIFVSSSNFNGSFWQSGGTPTVFNNCLSYSYTGVTLGSFPNGSGNFENTTI